MAGADHGARTHRHARRRARRCEGPWRISHAGALAARLTGEARYFTMAISAAETLRRYLATPIPGLWYDRISPQGDVIDEPAPASTFYHLVVAIAEIGDQLACLRPAPRRRGANAFPIGGEADRPLWMTESGTFPLLNATSRAVVDWVEARREPEGQR